MAIKTTTAVKVNLPGIQARASQDPRFRELMTYLSERGRARGKTSYFRARRVLNMGREAGWTYDELDQYFSILEDEGAGEVDRPRDGKLEKAYVRWNVDLKSLGKAALEKKKSKIELEPLSVPNRKLPEVTQADVVTLDRDNHVVSAQATRSESRSLPPSSRPTSDHLARVAYRGFEFEIDLDKVPNELMKFIRRL